MRFYFFEPRFFLKLSGAGSIWLALLLFVSLSSPQVAADKEPQYSSSEVGRHSSAEDCWVIVEGVVFDITKGLKTHEEHTPSLPDSCGKDASEAWLTKGIKGEKHKKKSEIKLKTYRIGVLKND